MKRWILAIALLLSALPIAAQRTNTFYVDQFDGATVGEKLTKSQAVCSPVTIPCVQIFNPTLAAWPKGTVPTKCAQCIWLDYTGLFGGLPSGANSSFSPMTCVSNQWANGILADGSLTCSAVPAGAIVNGTCPAGFVTGISITGALTCAKAVTPGVAFSCPTGMYLVSVISSTATCSVPVAPSNKPAESHKFLTSYNAFSLAFDNAQPVIADVDGLTDALNAPKPYVVAVTYTGKPGVSAVLIRYPAPLAFTIPDGCTNTKLVVGTAATAPATFSLKKNAVEFGTVAIAANGTVTLTCSGATAFAAGDIFTFVAPGSQDATLADLGAAFYAIR